MEYRREIDGLRALAVLPVIAFHAGLPAVPGGFVGVDIFFVISGYLIFSIIAADLKEGTFSIATFYERRARRILPALTFVALITAAASFAIMLPEDLAEFGESLVSISAFLSNVYFWQTSGYFETAAELKPMLHTWSLAVEEQYYLLFPLALMACWKLRRNWVLALILVAACASLLIAIVGVNRSPVAAFFLLFTRAWELLLGAMLGVLISLYPDAYRRAMGSTGRANALALLGVGLMVVPMLTYSDATPFPGLSAVAPCLGAALVIGFGREGTWVGAVLGLPLIVSVGLISYSAYLWHQPMLSLARHAGLPADPLIIVVIVVACLAFAYGSWRYIELPFRNRAHFSRRQVFALSLTSLTLVAALGISMKATGGFEEQWWSRQSEMGARTYELVRARSADLGKDADFGQCKFRVQLVDEAFLERTRQCHSENGPGIFIIGDSHAADLFGAFARLSTSPFVVGISDGGCRLHSDTHTCDFQKFSQFVADSPQMVAVVVYEQAGFYLMKDLEGNDGGHELFSKLGLNQPVPSYTPHDEYIGDVLAYLQSLAASAKVVWLGPKVEPRITAKEMLSLGCDYPFQLRPNLESTFDKVDDRAAAVTGASADPSLTYLSQKDLVEFLAPRDIMSCEQLFWRDEDHWTAAGETHFGAPIVRAVERMIGY